MFLLHSIWLLPISRKLALLSKFVIVTAFSVACWIEGSVSTALLTLNKMSKSAFQFKPELNLNPGSSSSSFKDMVLVSFSSRFGSNSRVEKLRNPSWTRIFNIYLLFWSHVRKITSTTGLGLSITSKSLLFALFVIFPTSITKSSVEIFIPCAFIFGEIFSKLFVAFTNSSFTCIRLVH